MILTDEQWQVVAPLIPPPSPAAGRGRPLIDEREVLDGILTKLSTDSPWSDLPSDYPSWQTCFRRYKLWQRTGLFSAIYSALMLDLRDRGKVDIEQILTNGTVIYMVAERQVIFCIATHLRGTWQYDLIMLRLHQLAQRLRKKQRLTIRGIY